MDRKKEAELKQIMRAERSRGSRHPVTEETLEIQRQIRRIGEMLANKECQRTEFINALRDDLGLKDESDRFRQLLALWDAYRSRQ